MAKCGASPKYVSRHKQKPDATSHASMALHATQKAFVDCVAPYKGFVAGRGSGKALALDTPIPTRDGWTTMGNVAVGDVVFDETGAPCRVIAATDIMHGRPCFKVTFSDGTDVVADAEHEWKTDTQSSRKGARRRTGGKHATNRWRNLPQCQATALPSIVTTQEIASTLMCRNERNHSIKVAGAIVGDCAELPIQPYTLGAWLGDGTSLSAQITVADHEVLDAIHDDGYETIEVPSQAKGAAHAYVIVANGIYGAQKHPETGRFYTPSDQFISKLTSLGLVGPRGSRKTIPQVYLRASVLQRRELLMGLMDTDGYCKISGNCEFTTTTPALAMAFLELCNTLGLKAVIRTGRAMLKGRDCGAKYRICFTPYWPVFKIARKAERLHPAGQQALRQKRRYITDAEPVESVPVRCIEVDSPSHLYLCSRSFIPTHNSLVGAYDFLVNTPPGKTGLVIAPTYRMLSDSTQRSFIEVARKLGLWNDAKFRKTDNQAMLNNDVEVLFRSGDEPNKLRGSSVYRIWGDECSLLKEEVFGIAIACLRWPGEDHLTFSATFTPSGKDHWTFKTFGDEANPNVKLFHCSTRDNPFLSEEFYDRLLLQYGKGEGGILRARQELEGEFVCVEGAEWPADWFGPEAWFDDWPIDDQSVWAVMLDSSKGIGGKTGDYSCFAITCYSRGTLYVEFNLDNMRNASGMAETAVEIQKNHNPHYFGIEAEFGGNVLVDDILNRAEKHGVMIPLCLVPTHGTPKEVRIRRLTPYLAQGMVRFKNTPQTRDGVLQFESFPFARHDDSPDSLEGAIRLLNESGLF